VTTGFRWPSFLGALISVLVMVGCSGGGGSGPSRAGVSATNTGCDGSCSEMSPGAFLTEDDVKDVISRAVAEAVRNRVNATIAVVDRVGNPLAVFRMNDPDLRTLNDTADPIIPVSEQPTVIVTSRRTPLVNTGLENINIIPDTAAALAKAITGAYLSSEGNAFTTRTANQIVQENFNPGETNQISGPLFGVQFTQLPCSDLSERSGNVGPKRSPLGLSADPGGLPLYKFGTPVGGIGVIADGVYGMDLKITNTDADLDEIIALAGTFDRAPPVNRRGNQITVDGKTFRFTDVTFDDVGGDFTNPPDFDTEVNGVRGELVAVRGYTDGTLVSGTRFGTPESGIVPADSIDPTLYPGLDAFVLVDNNGENRFPPIDGTDGLLTADEVTQILRSAIDVANRGRAQIRQPLGTAIRVSASVVDTNGVVLGLARTRDGPVFGIDTGLQKGRTAAFFSNRNAGDVLQQAPPACYLGFLDPDNPPDLPTLCPNFSSVSDYVDAVRRFIPDPTALSNGVAFSDRAGGNLSRPFFPDGLNKRGADGNGPLSKRFPDWSIFSTGLQLDLDVNAILTHVQFLLGLVDNDVGIGCSGLALAVIPSEAGGSPGISQLANGIQIFPGSVPIYKGDILAGGIGISGDGVDQDDMISFLGLHNAGVILGTVNNAAKENRADTIRVRAPGVESDVNLRYVQCPQAPFAGSQEQDVCRGL